MVSASPAVGDAREPVFVTPPPNVVRYNDWPSVTLPPLASFEPSQSVTVVMPYFEAPATLARSLAALEGQTYPRELLEVVIVDDGSRTPLKQPASPLDVKVVHQEDRGHGVARARNNGARHATHDILVFLDCDMMAEAELLAAHARWHHVLADALTLGFWECVSVEDISVDAVRRHNRALQELFSTKESDTPWLERDMTRTHDMTSRHDDLFRAMGGCFGVRRSFHEALGGADESFSRYGGEDTEFGYRAYTQGALLVPVREAIAWHQGRWTNREDKQRAERAQRAKLADLIAHPSYRPPMPGRIYAVPQYVVTLHAGDATCERIVDAAETILREPVGDLRVRIEIPERRASAVVRCVENHLGSDRRVRIAPARPALDDFPASPFHIEVSAAGTFDTKLVPRLRQALGVGAAAAITLPDGSRASITRAWARRRAQRTGKDVSEFGDVSTVKMFPWRLLIARMARRRRLRRDAPLRAGVAHVVAELRYVRGIRTGLDFARWFVKGVRWRLRQDRGDEPAVAVEGIGDAIGGEVVALGQNARRVFAATPRVTDRLSGRHVDLVVADTAAQTKGVSVPTVILADTPRLSIPAFDVAKYNPIGWLRVVENSVGALGSPRFIPHGARVRRVVAPTNHNALRNLHHLDDVRAFHESATSRAGVLVRLAATGLPIHLADRDRELEELLGTEVCGLMEADGGMGDDARESLSIKMRRVALRDHSLQSRVRQACEAVLPDPPELPKVSILLVTKRPQLLSWAMANVAKQSYPNLELILALHGGAFDDQAVAGAVGGLAVPIRTVRVSEHRSFGTAMNAASADASGLLLTKMDDDDLYGTEHIWDLVLAHAYSGAQLVGKSIETIYLGKTDRTVRRFDGRSETFSTGIAGGTLLISPADLHRFGGWQRVHRYVDQALIQDVRRAGGSVYRTHGTGFVLVRRGWDHTWHADDEDFLANAHSVHRGWQPQLADIDGHDSHPMQLT